MCQKLSGYTHQCVISFIDLYQKTKKNFKDVQEVNENDQIYLCQKFVEIGKDIILKFIHAMKMKL